MSTKYSTAESGQQVVAPWVELIEGDCLQEMAALPAGSVDMILTDLPYGTTQNAWDAVIPFAPMWEQFWRLCPKGAVVLTAAQPFTSALTMSAVAKFWHSWTWVKPRPTGFQNAKKQPLRATEDVLVFGRGVYNPQGLVRIDKTVRNSRSAGGGNLRDDVEASAGKGGLRTAGREYVQEFTGYPKNVLEFGLDERTKLHPTQKPVALFEYLIKTYTNPGDTVLDCCAGSGTTGVAARNTGRNAILIERDPAYYAVAEQRLWPVAEEAGL